MIVDEFTGRILEGRRWSEGLHQAIEAKEGVSITAENQTLATITLQNYFRLYDKLSGMTGTALTEAQEFMKIYEMPVVDIPTHSADDPRRPQRPDLQDEERQVEGGRGRDKGPKRAGPAGARRHGLGGYVGDALGGADPQTGRPRRPQRQAGARRTGGRDDRAGGPDRRRDDRDQHGRPRRRHQARRRVPRGWPEPRLRSGHQPGDEGYDAGARRGVAEAFRDVGARRRAAGAGRSAAYSSAAPSATSRGASTTSCAGAPVARETPASRASTSRPRTT